MEQVRIAFHRSRQYVPSYGKGLVLKARSWDFWHYPNRLTSSLLAYRIPPRVVYLGRPISLILHMSWRSYLVESNLVHQTAEITLSFFLSTGANSFGADDFELSLEIYLIIFTGKLSRIHNTFPLGILASSPLVKVTMPCKFEQTNEPTADDLINAEEE